jgi:hypothetical protein
MRRGCPSQKPGYGFRGLTEEKENPKTNPRKSVEIGGQVPTHKTKAPGFAGAQKTLIVGLNPQPHHSPEAPAQLPAQPSVEKIGWREDPHRGSCTAKRDS